MRVQSVVELWTCIIEYKLAIFVGFDIHTIPLFWQKLTLTHSANPKSECRRLYAVPDGFRWSSDIMNIGPYDHRIFMAYFANSLTSCGIATFDYVLDQNHTGSQDFGRRSLCQFWWRSAHNCGLQTMKIADVSHHFESGRGLLRYDYFERSNFIRSGYLLSGILRFCVLFSTVHAHETGSWSWSSPHRPQRLSDLTNLLLYNYANFCEDRLRPPGPSEYAKLPSFAAILKLKMGVACFTTNSSCCMTYKPYQFYRTFYAFCTCIDVI